MLFSSPADPEVTSVADTSSGRAFFLARQVGRFASVQVFVQLIGFATGILLVRLMEQREYALFTVTNTMQGTMNILADIGISIGMISIGGRVWQDSRRFGELVQTGLKLRRTLGAIAVIAITPLLYYMLAKNPVLRHRLNRCRPARPIGAAVNRGLGSRAALAFRHSDDPKD
jgi:hypothetical protein